MASLDLKALQAALDGLFEEKAALSREREQVEKLKEVVELNLERFKARVKLNIGDAHFETMLSTLQRYPDTMLGTMFSGRDGIHVPIDEQGYVFIDRDPTHFKAILNFLRTGKVSMPMGKSAREELKTEANFYLLHEQIARAIGSHTTETDGVPHVIIVRTDLRNTEQNRHQDRVNLALCAEPCLRIVSTNTTSIHGVGGGQEMITTLATKHEGVFALPQHDDSVGCSIM
jgi:hypothetical protein